MAAKNLKKVKIKNKYQQQKEHLNFTVTLPSFSISGEIRAAKM